MAKKLTDNEWAAGFIGLADMGTGYSWPDAECDYRFSGYKSKAVTEGEYSSSVWQPDSDLNQFKLVLDKYREWWDKSGSTWNSPDRFTTKAWNDPASTLNAIREAVGE